MFTRRLFSSLPFFSVLATRQTELFCREFETPKGSTAGLGLVNGVNKKFTLTYPPNGSIRLNVFLNGLLQREGGDYTLVGKVITFTNAPSGTDRVEAQYHGQFSI
jgi:hypothetical protein